MSFQDYIVRVTVGHEDEREHAIQVVFYHEHWDTIFAILHDQLVEFHKYVTKNHELDDADRNEELQHLNYILAQLEKINDFQMEQLNKEIAAQIQSRKEDR